MGGREWVFSQQQNFTEAIEQMDNKRTKYWDEMKRPGRAIYYSKAVLDIFKGNRVPGRGPRFGGMHVSFGGHHKRILPQHV